MSEPAELTPNQVFAETSMVALAVTVVSVMLGVFTWRRRWHFLQDTTISVLLGAGIGWSRLVKGTAWKSGFDLHADQRRC